MPSDGINGIDQFLLLFKTLKDRAGGSVERLATFYSQSEPLKRANDELAQFVCLGNLHRALVDAPSKWYPSAPEDFVAEWADFVNTWQSTVYHLWLPIDLSGIAGDAEPTPRRTVGLSGPSLDPDQEDLTDDDKWFDPLYHDGGKAFELAFRAAEEEAEFLDTDHESVISRASSIGLQAYDYLCGTIGFNPHSVFRRWLKVPVIFAPEHVSRKYHWASHGSLMSLVDDAVRAYVFGAPAAAIAMCRAALEMVLKEHYSLLAQNKGRMTPRWQT